MVEAISFFDSESNNMQLSPAEIQRYSRHLTLEEVGIEGQNRLKNSSVLAIGTGGLGSPLLLYLAAAGVGKIGIIDFDIVDESNLQRQIIHSTNWLAKPKTDSAKSRIQELNPYCKVISYNQALTSENALDILKDYDVICDGTDNFPTRYLANDACVILGKPYVYGSILKFEGQASVFNLTKDSPNYRDLVPEPPPPGMVPSCAEGGVIGVLPGLVGTIQATETIKILTNIGEPLDGRILLIDALAMKFKQLKLVKNYSNTITRLIDYEQFCNPAKKTKNDQHIESIDVFELKERLTDSNSNAILIDVRTSQERDICSIEESIHIPQKEIESKEGIEKIRKLGAANDIFIMCKAGSRSRATTEILIKNNIKAINVTGGIIEWIEKIDGTMNKY